MVPVLKQINPLCEEAILHLTQQCKDDIDYLEQQAEDALSKAEVKDGYCTDFFTNAQSNSLKSNFLGTQKVKILLHPMYKWSRFTKAIEAKTWVCNGNRHDSILRRRKFYFLRVGKMDKSQWEFLANSTEIALKRWPYNSFKSSNCK